MIDSEASDSLSHVSSTNVGLSNIQIPVVCALRDLISARGRYSNSRGRDNARAEASALSARDRYYIARVH